MDIIHESHIMTQKIAVNYCTVCYACACHEHESLAKPCHNPSNWDPESSPVEEAFEPHTISTREIELKSGRIVLIVECSCEGFDVACKGKITADSLVEIMDAHSEHLRTVWGC